MSQSIEVKDESYTELLATIQSLKDENLALTTKQKETEQEISQLKEEIGQMQQTLTEVLKELTSHDERHATILGELNAFKESIMNNNSLFNNKPEAAVIQLPVISSNSTMRSIPAPSKILVDDNKKKDNRLIELRRITRECMNVDDEEAGLRLYKLQKTMVHVVSDLKKYMKSKNEDISKSWKSIDISTQRVAFEMVEREASSLGVPLSMCIGYWGARRLVSKSWANALRTTKKNIKSGLDETKEDADANTDDALDGEESRQSKKIKT